MSHLTIIIPSGVSSAKSPAALKFNDTNLHPCPATLTRKMKLDSLNVGNPYCYILL